MNRDSFSHDKDIIEILKGLESKNAEYPHELLVARRKLFLEQLEQHTQIDLVNEPAEKDPQLLGMFRSLKALEPEYPREMLARRRSLLKQQLKERSRVSVWNALQSTIRNILAGLRTSSRTTVMRFAPASVVAAGVAMVAFVVFALYGNSIQPANPVLPQNEVPVLSPVLTTPTQQAEIICRDGYEPPLCLAPQPDTSQNLTYPGNGKARPAVAKDAVSDQGQIHRAANANDGLYGPGASWVSKSRNSWIKIDLGTTTHIDTVAFSRDRLGTSNDGGNPGRFIIAVAITDNIYADGNSSNDELEYINVYDSRRVGFDGIISGPETVIASFDLQRARFIKITFENAGTAIDEVQAFASRTSQSSVAATQTSSRDDETSPRVSTPVPTNTPLPLDTATALPTDTPLPVDTATPLPADTATPLPEKTDTPIPTDVLDETPVPTDAATPLPTESPFPPPVEVPAPVPTQEPTPTDADVAP
jgi:hypothetical protein